jgi:hypothetical protein
LVTGVTTIKKGIDAMEHTEAIASKTAEKYLLNELTPETREQFEEHFFSCSECALDVRAGMAFIEHSKVLLAPEAQATVVPNRSSGKRIPARPLAWLRPALALSALAALIAVIGYQNVVTFPAVKQRLIAENVPQILPSLSLVNANSRGTSRAVITTGRDEPFLLFIDIPSESRFSSYTAELQAAENNPRWSLDIPAEAAKNTVPIRMPGLTKSGVYTLLVRGVSSSDSQRPEVASYNFELQIR